MGNQPSDVIVRDFLENGAIVYLSDDAVFIRALRNIISRVIGFKGEVLFPFATPGPAMTKCLELRDQGTPCIVFIERMLAERPTTDFILRLKREFPDVRMIVLTWQTTKETVAYFFELGVSRVLVKPASANKVIEEMAATLDPPTALKKQMARCADLLEAGSFDEALEVTDRILLLTPDSARGLVMRGDALMGIGEQDKAVQAYMAAHESRPIFMAPLIKLAAALDGMDDERALAYMKELDEISPLNPERKLEIAKQHLRRNEADVAEEYLDKSVEAAEREHLSIAGDLTERIVDAVASRAPDLAVKYLNRVIDGKRVLGRDDLVHFNRLGIILRGEGKWKEAVEVYQKALSIASNDPAIHYNMGLAYWEGDERMTALRCFEAALKLDPHFYEGSVGAAMNIGSLYLDLRHYQDAEPFFMHVLQIDPGNATAQRRLDKARNRIPPASVRRETVRDEYDVDAPSPVRAAAPRRKSNKPQFNVDDPNFDTRPGKKKDAKRSGKITKLDF
jgi:tetratricopeptide (TPR) repeat protein